MSLTFTKVETPAIDEATEKEIEKASRELVEEAKEAVSGIKQPEVMKKTKEQTKAAKNGSEDKPQEKKKRGRPKMTEEQKAEAKKKREEAKKAKEEKKDPDASEEIEAELDKLRNKNLELHDKQGKDGKTTITVDKDVNVRKEHLQFINGYMLLIVCDVFFPFIISKMFKKTMEANGKTRTDLKMTAEERKEFEPLADAAAKELSLNLSPTQTFVFAMAFVYADKIDD